MQSPSERLAELQGREPQELTRRAVALIRRCADADARDAGDLQELALLQLALRLGYQDSQGRPDWLGISHLARRAVSELYARAGLSKEARGRVQISVREVISSLRQELLTHDQLADYGLADESIRTRRERRRRARTAAADAVLPDTPDHRTALRVVTAAAAMLADITPADVHALPPVDRAAALGALNDLASHATELLRADGVGA